MNKRRSFQVIEQCLKILEPVDWGKRSCKRDPQDHLLVGQEEEKPDRVRNLHYLGIDLVLENYGMCRFRKIRLLRDGKEVYRIERDGETRFESFFGVARREYEGNQFSFCEYMDLLAIVKRLPKIEELMEYCLERGIAEMYDSYMKRILGKKI